MLEMNIILYKKHISLISTDDLKIFIQTLSGKEISNTNFEDTQYGDISFDDFVKHFKTLYLDESAHVF